MYGENKYIFPTYFTNQLEAVEIPLKTISYTWSKPNITSRLKQQTPFIQIVTF